MKSLIKKTSILTTSNIITRILGMLFFVVLARILSVSDYGSFRYLVTLSFTYSILFSGFTVALTRYISQYQHNKKKTNQYFSSSLFVSIISFIIILIIIILFNENPIYLILFLFSSFIDFFYTGLIRGFLDYLKLAGFKLLENAIQLTIIILFFIIYKEINFTLAVIFYAFSGFISLITFELMKRSKVKFSFGLISKEKIKQLAKYAIAVMIGSIGWELMFNLSMIFIKHYLDVEQVAYYSIGRTIVQVFTFLPIAITTILLPHIAKNKKDVKKKLRYAVAGNLIFSILILIGLMIFGKLLIDIIFGSRYLPGFNVVFYLSLAQIFISSYLIYASIWQGVDKPIIPSLILLFTCVLNIIGNILLIPAYGIVGASISTAITSFIAFILSIYIFHFKNGIQKITKKK